MSRRSLIYTCLVEGCARDSASHLGVCGEHWQQLPQELRARWWEAWAKDCRTHAWGAARLACIGYLERGGTGAPSDITAQDLEQEKRGAVDGA